MIHKMSDIDSKFPHQDADLQPRVELDFDFLLNTETIHKEIKKLNYKQLKGKTIWNLYETIIWFFYLLLFVSKFPIRPVS